MVLSFFKSLAKSFYATKRCLSDLIACTFSKTLVCDIGAEKMARVADVARKKKGERVVDFVVKKIEKAASDGEKNCNFICGIKDVEFFHARLEKLGYVIHIAPRQTFVDVSIDWENIGQKKIQLGEQ